MMWFIDIDDKTEVSYNLDHVIAIKVEHKSQTNSTQPLIVVTVVTKDNKEETHLIFDEWMEIFDNNWNNLRFRK